jgi:hypothetical protein
LTTPEIKVRRLSEVLDHLLTVNRLNFADCVDEFGERAMGGLMALFSVPNMLPMPPGTSAILGLPLMLLTFQLMIGRRSLWLPRAMRERTVPRTMLQVVALRAGLLLRRGERILKPRHIYLASGAMTERVMGFVAFVLAFILFLPLPLVNLPPAAGIFCFGIALLERDGLMALIGYGWFIGTIILMVAIADLLFAATEASLHLIGV